MKLFQSIIFRYATIVILCLFLTPVIYAVLTISYYYLFGDEHQLQEDGGSFAPVWMFLIAVGFVFVLFVVWTWVFIIRIRRRFNRLQVAMKMAESADELTTISVGKKDEIADMENSYNIMVERLMESRRKEERAEKTRNELIANLSHDLRTPLTIMRTHLYNLKAEHMSSAGKRSLMVVDDRIQYTADLIENLFSFTLLSSGKHPYRRENVDIVESLKKTIANWYSTLHEQEFEIVIDLPEYEIYWDVDLSWFQRIWDNLIQNILRYAGEGKYINLSLHQSKIGTSIQIRDHGPGMHANPEQKGTGLGLNIISLMAEEMGIEFIMESNETGTVCTLHKSKT